MTDKYSDTRVLGIDAQEMQEWIESFDAVLRDEGEETAGLLLELLRRLGQEQLRQQRNVIAPFAQWR